MGLNLKRKDFIEWIEENLRRKERSAFIKKFSQHITDWNKVENWTLEDEDYPKVGGYSGYWVFGACLEFLTEGDFTEDEEDEIECEAVKDFRANLKPASIKIPYVNHFLDTDPWGTIFIPVLFKEPLKYHGINVASKPGAERALEVLAKALSFDIMAPLTLPEEIGDKWKPLLSVQNIARIIYQFFKEKPEACVEYT